MSNLDTLKSLNIEDILRRDLNDASLVEVGPAIKNLRELFLAVGEAPEGEVPDPIWSHVMGSTDEFLQLAATAKGLRVGAADFYKARVDTINRFRNMYSTLGAYRPFVLSLRERELAVLSQEARNALQNLANITAQAVAARDKAEAAAEAVKEAADLTAVSELAGAYKDEADLFDTRSKLWGRLAAGVALGGAVLLGVFVHESLTTDSFNIAQAIIRAVVIAAVFGVFSTCLRIYEGYRHLEVVNRHRVNIGRTYEVFKAAQPSDRARDVMAAITAEHMLTFGKSGMIPKDPTLQTPGTAVSDLVKALLERKGS